MRGSRSYPTPKAKLNPFWAGMKGLKVLRSLNSPFLLMVGLIRFSII